MRRGGSPDGEQAERLSRGRAWHGETAEGEGRILTGLRVRQRAQRGQHARDGKFGQAARVAEQDAPIATGPPHGFRRIPPKDHARDSQGGGEVGDAGIMPDEGRASAEVPRQINQGQALGDPKARGRATGRQAV